jgi:hypothetical protein
MLEDIEATTPNLEAIADAVLNRVKHFTVGFAKVKFGLEPERSRPRKEAAFLSSTAI